MPALHEGVRALTGKEPSHLCDSWRWLTLEGEFYADSNLQVMITTNGVLLSVTADVKTATGVQIITRGSVAMA